MILYKKKFLKKKSANFFLTKLFLILLESSETHFELVASEIRAKLDNLISYVDNLVNFLENFEYKIDHIYKSEKLFFSEVSEHFVYFGTKKWYLFGPKIQYGHF